MDRASFIKKSLMGLSLGVAAPTVLAACSSDTKAAKPDSVAKNAPLADSKAGGVYYTAEAPGRWGEKVKGHLPGVVLEPIDGQKTKVKVVTTHPMKGYEHYIIKHQLLDANFEFIDEQVFDPKVVTSEPESEFILTNYSGPLYALSYCNLHDVWISQVNI